MRKILPVFLTVAFVCMGAGSSLAVPLVGVENSMEVIGRHHTPGDGTHEEHYFAKTGDLHHYAWFSSTPASPGPIVIKFDYRTRNGFANSITAAQKANAVAAMTAWTAGTNGKLQFMQDTVSPEVDILNIGTGDLAALGFVSGPGGTLGLGGGIFTHGAAVHSVTRGIAWQDFADNWDTIIGNGNPPGTVDYFTVVGQEIGHAMGLGHTTGSFDMMFGAYNFEKTGINAVDVGHITSQYGAAAAIPEPGTLTLISLGLGMAGIGFLRRRRNT